jgi:hypothetical protein
LAIDVAEMSGLRIGFRESTQPRASTSLGQHQPERLIVLNSEVGSNISKVLSYQSKYLFCVMEE